VLPVGSFGTDTATLDGVDVLAMSAAGMLAMKVQHPSLRNGRPWRPKDVADVEVLRRVVGRHDDAS
jgi:hypothetical protein